MELINKDSNKCVISFSINEIEIINNALNEVCHGIDLYEFETRIGATIKMVKELLNNINSIFYED